MTTATTTPTVRTGVLAEVLCNAKVLAPTRRLLEAELRAQRARVSPNTPATEAPRRREIFLAESDARKALEDLTKALADVASGYAQKEIR